MRSRDRERCEEAAGPFGPAFSIISVDAIKKVKNSNNRRILKKNRAK
jgi:hypothetical protein